MSIPGRDAQNFIHHMVDPKVQVQPNGVDLTVRRVFRIRGVGEISFDSKKLPEYEELKWDSNGRLKLEPGAYIIEYNEVIEVPRDCIAMVFPRSTILRMGCDLRGALWDSGYVGRSRSLLIVYNPIVLHKNARIAQLVYFKVVGEVGEVYRGEYQYENIE